MRPAVVREMRLPSCSSASAGGYGSAGRGRGDAAAEALEQLGVKILLQLADLGADGRLGAVHGPGGLRETLEPDNLQEGVELVEIHKAVPATSVGCIVAATGEEPHRTFGGPAPGYSRNSWPMERSAMASERRPAALSSRSMG